MTVTSSPAGEHAGTKPLTRRQRQLLALVANGNTNAQTARALHIHERTVNRHMAEAFRALGARDRTHAVAIAILTGQLGAADVQLPGQQREQAAA